MLWLDKISETPSTTISCFIQWRHAKCVWWSICPVFSSKILFNQKQSFLLPEKCIMIFKRGCQWLWRVKVVVVGCWNKGCNRGNHVMSLSSLYVILCVMWLPVSRRTTSNYGGNMLFHEAFYLYITLYLFRSLQMSSFNHETTTQKLYEQVHELHPKWWTASRAAFRNKKR